MKKQNISFLMGAGFSIPAGAPSASQLGEKIIEFGEKITKKKIHRHSITYDPLEFFLMAAVEFYNAKNEFNYEEFYDFIYELPDDNSFIDFLSDYFAKYKLLEKVNHEYILQYFLDLFEYYQWWIFHCLYSNDNVNNADKYSGFFNLIKSHSSDNLYLHTLNHDLLLENFSSKGFLPPLDDGFFNNDRYSCTDMECREWIPCPYFANKYSSNIRIYKLHGSLNYFNTFTENENGAYTPNSIVKAQTPYKDIIFFDNIKQDSPPTFNPNFLTGKQYKESNYYNNMLYTDLFHHFDSNLTISDKLIIIGYSGNDEGINRHILTSFDLRKPCYIIDPFPGEKIIALKQNFSNATLIKCSISDFTPENIGLQI